MRVTSWYEAFIYTSTRKQLILRFLKQNRLWHCALGPDMEKLASASDDWWWRFCWIGYLYADFMLFSFLGHSFALFHLWRPNSRKPRDTLIVSSPPPGITYTKQYRLQSFFGGWHWLWLEKNRRMLKLSRLFCLVLQFKNRRWRRRIDQLYEILCVFINQTDDRNLK